MNPRQNQSFFNANQIAQQEVTNRVADFIKERYSEKARQGLDPRGDLNLDNESLDSAIDGAPLDVLKGLMGDSWSAVVDGVLADPEVLLLLAA